MRKITRIICDLYQLEICSHPTPASSWTRAKMKNRARLFLQRNVQLKGGQDISCLSFGESSSEPTDQSTADLTCQVSNRPNSKLTNRPTGGPINKRQTCGVVARVARRNGEWEWEKKEWVSQFSPRNICSAKYVASNYDSRPHNLFSRINCNSTFPLSSTFTWGTPRPTSLFVSFTFSSLAVEAQQNVGVVECAQLPPARYHSDFLRSYHHALAIRMGNRGL